MDKRAVRKERRREQVREEILEATQRVLLARGLGGLTLAAVARELQLTKAALYYYFASKEAIVFELIYASLHRHATSVGDAVDETASGAAAIEALIREATAYYEAHPEELRLTYLVPQVGTAAATPFGPEMLEKIRPYNDRLYGAVANKISADQDAGVIARSIDGRRLAFIAHTSVVGMLTVEGLVEVADDAPLIHTHNAMVEELVMLYRARLEVA